MASPSGVCCSRGNRINSLDARKFDHLGPLLGFLGAEPEPSTPDESKAFVNSHIRKWIDLADKAGIKLGG